MTHPHVQTIQATGKGPKAAQALGVVLMLLGTVSCTGGELLGAVALWIIGPVLYAVGRLWGWWSHG